MKKRYLQGAVMLALLSVTAVSEADEFHYNNILVGDRASGMGGAYTAVSDDAGGMYYNPAGIAYSTGKNLSASVNAYSVSSRIYSGVIGGKDWTRTSSTLLPNFFGIIQPVGKLKVGFSYAVPDSNQEDQDQTFNVNVSGWGSATQVINFNNKNDTTLFGPSAAVHVADNFSVGATLYVHNRSTEAILNQSVQSDDKVNYIVANSYFETDEWGVKPIIGFMWAPVERLSLGFAVSKTFIFNSEIMSNSTVSTPGVLTLTNASLGTVSDKRKYPCQITAGVAIFPNSSLLLSGDISYFTPVQYEYFAFNETHTQKYDAVVNGAVGAEYFFNKSWALRGGLFTDFANTPKVVVGGKDQKEHIDLFGGSLTASHFTKNTSISCGGSYKFGSGKSQVLGGASPTQNASSQNWTLFVSSSFSY